MDERKYIRGSEWRKWDLHIHTKGTSKNDQFTSADFNAFCVAMFKTAIKKDIKAIGITDYFSIDNYKQVIYFQNNINNNSSFTDEEKNIISKLFILPNVELRMLPVTDTGRLINIHCIVNPDFISNLDNDFFNTLKYVGGSQDYLMNRQGIVSLGKSLDSSITDDNSAYKKGVDNFVVSYENLKKLLTNNPNLRENIIIVVSNSSNDGASAIQKHYDLFENENGSLDGVRKTIYQISDCIFSGNENDTIFFAGKNLQHSPETVKQKCGSLKPCIHGSDAHTEDKLFNPDNNRYCWIKADLTFNGLKQILYEPDERVKIQQDKPDEKRGYQVIDSVTLNEDDFWKDTIYLNENLNTIIGGRSTGKSTLLKSIAKKISDKIKFDDEKDFIKNHLDGVSVKWSDGESGVERDIDFFPQSYMHEIAKDKEKTDALIKKIISNKDENKLISDYETKNNEIKKSLSKNILDVFQLQTDIENLQVQLKEKGDKKGVETEIQRLNTKIQELNKNASITTQELETYQSSLRKIAEAELLVSQAENDLRLFPRMKTTTVIKGSYPIEYEFDNLSFPLNRDELYRYFKNLTTETEKKWVEIVELFEKSTEEKKNIHTKKIEQEKQTDIYKKGAKYYSDNKELNDIQNKLKEENRKLQEINGLTERLSQLEKRKNDSIAQIVTDHNSYSSNAQSLVQDLKIEHDEVKITTKISCKKPDIKSFLESRLNQRGNERQSYIDNFANQYESNLSDTIKDFLSKALNKEIDYKSNNTNQNVVTEFFTTNWFDISFELFYQNDVFSEMSQGKQAFVILKLLLEFSTKECPILIDQPEDSLDNRAIYNELVQYLRTKKKQRQIILVTHNPNVVVSADAENVIVANQNGKNSLNKDNVKFQYINGSLEDTKLKDDTNQIVLESQGIREHVCEILEGGKEAFENREKKYGFKK
jgi:ABC-type cobalamin/Fe3+-siderophores transport system ATPase subunit